MKISRECVQFQIQAAKNLEMLLLLSSGSVSGPSLVPTYFNSSDRNHGAPSLHRRHRHHRGDHSLHQHGTHIKDEAVHKPHDKVNAEPIQSHYQQLSGTINGSESTFISTENVSSDLGYHSVGTIKGRAIDLTTESSVSSLGTGDSKHTSADSISPFSTGVTGYTNSSISSPGIIDTEHTKESAPTSQVITHSIPSPTGNTDIASEHSITVMPINKSLDKTSFINSSNDHTFLDATYKTSFADTNKTVALAPSGSLETPAGHHRQKRDLLTGWMIFPGTKWCGDGDIAESKHDMGYHLELDKCCRRHDLCPLVISRLTWKYGMFNYRLHTLSHCRCDR
ncbi:unnamed protein product, partial [Candidula unifasciata]